MEPTFWLAAPGKRLRQRDMPGTTVRGNILYTSRMILQLGVNTYRCGCQYTVLP